MFFVAEVGQVHRAGSTFVATPFVCFLFVPLFPVARSTIHHEGPSGEVHATVATGLVGDSLFRAFVRVWGPLLAVAVAPMGLTMGLRGPEAQLALGVVAVFVLLGFGAGLYAHLRTGELRADEEARRLVHAEILGFAADPAIVPSGAWETRLVRAVVRRARRLGAAGYRESGRTWDQVARDPSVTDRDFLAAAMTLARRQSAHRAQPVSTSGPLRGLEDALFARLVALDPGVLTRAAKVVMPAPSPLLGEDDE